MSSSDEAPKTILAVDDEPDAIIGMRAVLEAEGYEVLKARDGEQALVVLRTQRPDLIVLDVLMPGMDGWETLSTIQADERLEDIPVLMLTALGQPQDIGKGIGLGCTWYYTKPITNYHDFVLVVRRILEGVESPEQT